MERGAVYTRNEVWPPNMEDNILEATAIGSCGPIDLVLSTDKVGFRNSSTHYS